MTPGARAVAAIEILDDIAARNRPASQTLKDWGVSHRFAGSGDRAAIGNLVFDALRQKSSLAWRMGDDSTRALVLGALHWVWGIERLEISSWLNENPHSDMTLTETDRDSFVNGNTNDAPAWVQGDYPEWLHDSLVKQFGEHVVAECASQGLRAPMDLRANRLKTSQERVLKALSKFNPHKAPVSPDGIRIEVKSGPSRPPPIGAEPGFNKGHYELQDEGSQISALLTGAAAGLQVADICAGAGGKTLALSSLMANKGQVHAYDSDRHRLKNIHDRLRRAGARNVQVLEPGEENLAVLEGKMDIVMVDAPCTGSGTWRRHPDTKWRLSEATLPKRLEEQRVVLDQAASLTRPGGKIVYVTCSVLSEENGDQVRAFLARHKEYALGKLDPASIKAVATRRKQQVVEIESEIQLTPLRDSTDGFFVACLERKS